MSDKKYELSIDPRILELLGPNLYTNIYYVLAELIANAYDADAHNVYVIATQDSIIVEDDGSGMSYTDGDIDKFLNVAGISRTNEEDRRNWFTPLKISWVKTHVRDPANCIKSRCKNRIGDLRPLRHNHYT